jgi:hypothetical protein
MVCSRCNRPVENGVRFCGNCGNHITPIQAHGATELVSGETRQYETVEERTLTSQTTPVGQTYDPLSPISHQGTVSPFPQAISSTPPPVRMPPFVKLVPPPRRSFVFITAIIALLVIGLSLGFFTLLQSKAATPLNKSVPTAMASSTMGSVYFSSSLDSHEATDTVKIDLTSLPTPAQGTQYDAWLVNEQQEQTILLGQLSPQRQGFSLTYTDKGQNLLGLGDKILVTQEQDNASLPTGKNLLTAQFPPLVFIHIKHILFAFPTAPHHIGLLVGLLQQTRQAEAQAILLNGIAGNGNTMAVTCAAQNLLNIIEGQHGQHYSALLPQCSSQSATVHSDGFGLLGPNGYIALAGQHASLCAQSYDTTSTIKFHARLVEITLTNVNGWMTTVDKDALSLRFNPSNNGKLQEIVTLTERAIDGVDLDNDGRVDPVAGEAGILTAFQQGQQMAQIALQKA